MRSVISAIVRPVPALIVMAGLLLVAGGEPARAQDTGDAPDWSLEAIDGRRVSFAEQLAQGPVIVSFWATWCKPCLKELPHLNRLAGEFDGRISILAVSTDASKSVAKVAPYIQAKGYDDLTVLLDPGAEVQALLQVGNTVPFLIMYDSTGREVYRHIGYKDGDEQELARRVDTLLASAGIAPQPEMALAGPMGEAVSATDHFEYSYAEDTRQEIFENWLDVNYTFGGFRTGIMLNSQSPSEEGVRRNEVVHRFLEFQTADVSVRAGHFWGLFGRGLLFNAYEDRNVRIDTRLDGLKATYRRDRLVATAFSGTPVARDIDVRGLDAEYRMTGSLWAAVTGLTYRPDDFLGLDDTVHRENVSAARARGKFSFGDFYVERGWKTGWEFDPTRDGTDYGKALYANLNLYHGPFSVSWEASDYERFEVVARADGITALNRPPALAREFTWTLLNRAPHTLNANDERGQNLDLVYARPDGWTLLGSAADIERHDGSTVYQLAYFSLEKERLGDFRLLGAFGYQESDGLRQTAAGEITWFTDDRRSLSLQLEQQHVRLEGAPGIDRGAYDEQWLKLEYETTPHWALAAILELNNKYDEQRAIGEDKGPFPAGQITYTLTHGGDLNLWLGQRQAGFLCSGGVCKFEPAFSGVELFGTFRY